VAPALLQAPTIENKMSENAILVSQDLSCCGLSDQSLSRTVVVASHLFLSGQGALWGWLFEGFSARPCRGVLLAARAGHEWERLGQLKQSWLLLAGDAHWHQAAPQSCWLGRHSQPSTQNAVIVVRLYLRDLSMTTPRLTVLIALAC
jgi:hypothetical protein